MNGPERFLLGERRLAAWINEGGKPQAAAWRWRLLSRWYAWWGDKLARAQEDMLAKQGLGVRPAIAPLFIMGFWRSGTTLVHEWAGAVSAYAGPQTWQCFAPRTFRLMPPPDAKVVGRPMDGGTIGTTSPQEDEFALLLLGEPSLYRGFVDPRRLRSLGEELLGNAAQPTRMPPAWLRFLAAVEQQGGAPLVLKSPNHIFRLGALLAEFPGSRFVWVGRDAEQVWRSNVNMWQKMSRQYGLWSAGATEFESFVTQAMEAYVRALEFALEHLPPGQVCWLDYERCIAEPADAIRSLMTFAGNAPGEQMGTASQQAARIATAHPPLPSARQSGAGTPPPAALVERVQALHRRAAAQWTTRSVA